ncbi:MAG: FG-GAP-like repeat-containing protein [Candidatus Zixiibacteriota bacterium]
MNRRIFELLVIAMILWCRNAFAPIPELMPGWPVEYRKDTGLFLGGPTYGGFELGGQYCLVSNLAGDDFGTGVFVVNGEYLSGWPYISGNFETQTLAVGDVDNDGRLEVVTGSHHWERQPPYERWGELRVIEDDGNVKEGFPVRLPMKYPSIPIVADLENDGFLDIVIFSQTEHIAMVFDGNGFVKDGWPVYIDDYYWGFNLGNGAVGDLDNDGNLDVINANADYIFAWNYEGELLPSFPFSIFDPRLFFADFVHPCLADIDGNGFLDILMTGMDFSKSGDGFVAIYDKDGELLPGWPFRDEAGIYTPAVPGDVNRDGELEVAISSSGYVYLLDNQGNPLPGWPQERRFMGWPISSNSDPLIADIDGDEYPDVIFNEHGYHPDPEETYAYLWAYRYDGDYVDGYPWRTYSTNYTCPALGDFDRDGSLNMFLFTTVERNYQREFYISLGLYEMGVPYDPETVEWGQYGHDQYNTSNYHYELQIPTIVEEAKIEVPESFRIIACHPNPFNEATNINYQLPTPCEVRLELYNLLGQKLDTILETRQEAGNKSLIWRPEGFTSGIYFLRLRAGDSSDIKRVTLLK